MNGKYIYFVMLELHIISWDWNQHHEPHRDHRYAKLDGENGNVKLTKIKYKRK
jgi:hypothetical protein